MTITRSLPLTDVTGKLPEVLASMTPGEELVLTTAGEAVAVITLPPRKAWPSQPGIAKGRAFRMDDDFDAPLADFNDYME